jgi:hypothetical protein
VVLFFRAQCAAGKNPKKDGQKMNKTELDQVKDFASSIRGQYIISQALCVAIDQMREVEPTHQEVSNISDMEYLRDELFPIYKAVQEANESR